MKSKITLAQYNLYAIISIQTSTGINMKYMGSKNRIAKHLLPIMVEAADKAGITTWVEPFVRGGNMIDKVPDRFKRVGYDFNEHVVYAMCDIRDRADSLPESITEEYYKEIRGSNPEVFNSWLRFVASFGGKFDGGYAREKGSDETTFCGYGKRNALKQSSKIQGVEFIHSDYKDLNIINSLIYCDPPYQSTTGYKTGEFNHDEFFDWCRLMAAKGNLVFVSEYNAPNDFDCVWQGEQKTNFSSSRKKATHNAVEKLFTIKDKYSNIKLGGGM